MAEPIPNLLFKYLGKEGGIKTLENLTLMFSNPADLNDPFEFLPRLELSPHSRDDERTSKAKNQVRDYGRNSFIFCMTSKEHNVRMWDHYGDKHQGLMIQLDFGKTLAEHRGWILRVHYDSEVRFDPLDKSLETEEKPKRFRDIVTHKGEDWKPESEYRWILPAQNCYSMGQEKEPEQKGELRLLDKKMKAFLPIPAASILKVTVGYHCSESLLSTVLQLRARHHAPWLVAKAKLSLDRFTFEDEIITA
ncbi:DUF2971 domain-containing protein [Prosthecobacter sp.]|jgi:hypothetical protein|uniref:DUF2971 domain-containing protein n=1 Tax=Prosthecobacter sp. TaxID=1965333 RepID=UPI003784B0A7